MNISLTNFVGRVKMLAGNIAELKQPLRAMEDWMLGSGLRYRHMINNGAQTYVIQYDMGRKAAYYIRSLFEITNLWKQEIYKVDRQTIYYGWVLIYNKPAAVLLLLLRLRYIACWNLRVGFYQRVELGKRA